MLQMHWKSSSSIVLLSSVHELGDIVWYETKLLHCRYKGGIGRWQAGQRLTEYCVKCRTEMNKKNS